MAFSLGPNLSLSIETILSISCHNVSLTIDQKFLDSLVRLSTNSQSNVSTSIPTSIPTKQVFSSFYFTLILTKLFSPLELKFI